MKFVPLVLSLALASSQLQTVKVGDAEDILNEVAEIIGGIFVGMALDVKAEDVAPCVKDAGAMGQDLEQAYYFYKLGTYTGKIKALALIAAAKAQLPDAMKECKAGSVEAGEAVARMVLAWKDPVSVLTHMGENLIVNGADIMAEVSYAMNAWEFKNYFDFGFYIGEAAFKILYVPPAKPAITSAAVADLAAGLANSLSLSVPCISFSDMVAERFDQALSEEFNFDGIVNLITGLGETLGMMVSELEAANGEVNLPSELLKAIEILKEPTSVVLMHRFILLNGIHLNHFMPLKINYKNSDWSGVGHYLGLTLKSLSESLVL